MIKLIDLLEEKMTPAQKKKRGKIFDKLVAGGMAKDKAGAIATSRVMSEKLDPVGKEDADIDNDGDTDKTDKYLANRRKAIAANLKKENISYPLSELYDLVEKLIAQDISKDEILRIVNMASAKLDEGMDHEVSMAVSSLEAIAEAIVELRQKLGNQERNIPGWIQDHIAKAENYIEQAAQGFHELKSEEPLDEEAKRMKKLAGLKEEDILNKIKNIPNKIKANKEKIKKAASTNPYNPETDTLPFGKTPSDYKGKFPNKPDDYDDPYDGPDED